MNLTGIIRPARRRPIRVGARCPDALHKRQEGTRLVIYDSRLTVLVFRKNVDPIMTLGFSRGHLSYDLLNMNGVPVLIHRWNRSRMELMTAMVKSYFPHDLLHQWILSNNHFVQFFLVDISTGFICSNRLSKMSVDERISLIDILMKPQSAYADQYRPDHLLDISCSAIKSAL